MIRKLCHLSLLVVLAYGCKEYEPPVLEPSNEPQFWVRGEIDGRVFELVADGSYRASSSVNTDSLGIEYYSGGVIADRCANCEEAFTMRWRSHSESSPDLDALMAVITPDYRFLEAQDTIRHFSIELNARTSGTADNIIWEVLGETYTGEQVVIELQEDETMTYIPVQLTGTFDGSCESSISDTIYLPNHGCDCEIDASLQSPQNMVYRVLATGGSAYGYSWSFKDQTVTASSQEVSYFYQQLPDEGFERAQVSITTGDCSATRVRNVVIDPDSNTCNINIDHSITTQTELIPRPAGIDLAELEVEYTNAAGEVFQSYWVQQPEWTGFQLEDHTDYSDPYFQSGQRSKRITARFSCLLTNGTDSMRIENGELVLPLGLGAN